MEKVENMCYSIPIDVGKCCAGLKTLGEYSRVCTQVNYAFVWVREIGKDIYRVDPWMGGSRDRFDIPVSENKKEVGGLFECVRVVFLTRFSRPKQIVLFYIKKGLGFNSYDY